MRTSENASNGVNGSHPLPTKGASSLSTTNSADNSSRAFKPIIPPSAEGFAAAEKVLADGKEVTSNMRKRTKQKLSPPSAPSIFPAKRSKRRIYADFRHLVFLERAAKQLKLPTNQRAPASLAQSAPLISNGSAPDSRQLPLEGIFDDAPSTTANNLDSHPCIPTARSVLLVIDQRINMFYGSKQKMKSVVAAEAAALIAWRALAQGDRVGALIFNDSKIVPCSPHHSRLRVMLILHALLNQNHSLSRNPSRRSNPGMLNEALLRADRLAVRDFLVVVITDASGHNQETQRLLANISRQNKLLVALVYDPRQNGLHNAGSFVASRDVVCRKAFINAVFCPNGISITSLSTRDDILTQLRRALRKSSRLPRSAIKQNATARGICGGEPEQRNEVNASPGKFESEGRAMKPEAPLIAASLQTELPLCALSNSY